MSKTYDIAVVPGDGIGPEVCEAAVRTICAAAGSERFKLGEHPAGAQEFLRSGAALPESTFEACKEADAILHGAAGIPGVTYADGTEAGIEFGLQLRFRLDLYANIRPIRLHHGTRSPLRDFEPGDIDYVILRENTEGLYASRGSGINLRDEVVSDSLVMTRKGVERIARQAFELARSRSGAPKDGVKRVTVCDKANVLRSYAFFRKVCTEVAADFPDIELDFGYADAMMVHMVRRPSFYDVIVTENMFGDIISDLGAVTVGGMGMSPSAEVGERNGFFQAAHGSAPDIAGQGIANPLGTILAGSMMLNWLGERHQDASLVSASHRLDSAVQNVLKDGATLPPDLGGRSKTVEVTDAVCRALDRHKVAA